MTDKSVHKNTKIYNSEKTKTKLQLYKENFNNDFLTNNRNINTKSTQEISVKEFKINTTITCSKILNINRATIMNLNNSNSSLNYIENTSSKENNNVTKSKKNNENNILELTINDIKQNSSFINTQQVYSTMDDNHVFIPSNLVFKNIFDDSFTNLSSIKTNQNNIISQEEPIKEENRNNNSIFNLEQILYNNPKLECGRFNDEAYKVLAVNKNFKSPKFPKFNSDFKKKRTYSELNQNGKNNN
jgi:hypothetical protein